MEETYRTVARLLMEHQPCTVLTGAGISAESGIQTFRSEGGLWEKYDPTVYASIDVFRRDPSKYWEIRGDFIRKYDRFQPNPAHLVLAQMEKAGWVRCVITQNIDGLHKKAGSRRVIEIHGSLREIRCLTCGKEYTAPHIPEGRTPYCACGGILKPGTVLFGEPLPRKALEDAYREARTCRSMLVIGTSAVVYPAAYLPSLAKERGATVVEINIERAFAAADTVILQKAGAAMPRLYETINAIKASANGHTNADPE
jgi:NAD-dependent deacetylase